jgi:hypothetical protein
MKTIIVLLSILISFSRAGAQQNNWPEVEKILGRTGTEQTGVYRVTFPRSDLKVKVGDFTINPGLALTSWAGFLKTGNKTAGMAMDDQVMMMGDLVLLDSEVAPVISKILASGLEVTAIHNHLTGESPAVKYVHFSGHGTATRLAESIKAVISVTGTPLTTQVQGPVDQTDWLKVQAVLGNGNPKGKLIQYGFPRSEKLTESGMEIPPYMGMATGVNFQMDGERAAITGDFVLLADEVNPVARALTDNGITVTALHNHMLYDNPRLFMMHFWAVGDPAKLAVGIKSALDKTNSKK